LIICQTFYKYTFSLSGRDRFLKKPTFSRCSRIGTDTLTGGSGNDTFVFNTPETGIDVITDFTVSVDRIQINQVEFGATDTNQFSFDSTNGALSFNSQQFATLENFVDLQDFDVNRDIEFL
jgi:Ca2+-binding RTX toxin-like protein